MPDPFLTLLVVTAILLVADLLVAGRAMTMTGTSAMAGAVALPVTAGARVVPVIALLLTLGGLG